MRHGYSKLAVSLLTGGDDRPYVFGLVGELLRRYIDVELIGSDVLDLAEFHGIPGITFLNLRGSMISDASFGAKIIRVLKFYAKLLLYAAKAKPRIFHILWNNKFQYFDRTLLMLYYRALGKRVVLTAHNVNAAKRDLTDSWPNRVTLRIQYRLCHCIFVHTEKMKTELTEQFGVRAERVRVIPFGINNSVPDTTVSREESRRKLDLAESDRAILFFGRITP